MLTKEELDAIRARAEAAEADIKCFAWAGAHHKTCSDSLADIPALLAHIDDLECSLKHAQDIANCKVDDGMEPIAMMHWRD